MFLLSSIPAPQPVRLIRVSEVTMFGDYLYRLFVVVIVYSLSLVVKGDGNGNSDEQVIVTSLL